MKFDFLSRSQPPPERSLEIVGFLGCDEPTPAPNKLESTSSFNSVEYKNRRTERDPKDVLADRTAENAFFSVQLGINRPAIHDSVRIDNFWRRSNDRFV